MNSIGRTTRTSERRGCIGYLRWASTFACIAAVVSAGGQTAARRQDRAHRPATRSAHRRSARAAKKPAPPVAQPPAVKLEDGKLTVDAHNSELSAILSDVARTSGMTIDGQQSDARVFGVYGPASPREVLTELLDGAGYNFMMVGATPGGAPRELLLSARTKGPAAPASASAEAAPPPSDDGNDDQEPPGPGAIVHVPPSVAQQADEAQTQQRVQQQLQRLQAMHDQEEKQQQNPPQ